MVNHNKKGSIIALSGRIGSGKDTIADVLVEKYGFKRESFAGTLKDAIAPIFGWDRELLEGKTPESRKKREEIDLWWAERLGIPHLTPRWVLQHVGTSVLKEHFHNDIWVASLEYKLLKLMQSNENIVISDARFTNELQALAKVGAKTWCVFRGKDPMWWEIAKSIHTDEDAMAIMLESDIHRSEWEWASYNFDVKIDNNKTLYDLYTQISDLVRA